MLRRNSRTRSVTAPTVSRVLEREATSRGWASAQTRPPDTLNTTRRPPCWAACRAAARWLNSAVRALFTCARSPMRVMLGIAVSVNNPMIASPIISSRRVNPRVRREVRRTQDWSGLMRRADRTVGASISTGSCSGASQRLRWGWRLLHPGSAGRGLNSRPHFAGPLALSGPVGWAGNGWSFGHLRPKRRQVLGSSGSLLASWQARRGAPWSGCGPLEPWAASPDRRPSRCR